MRKQTQHVNYSQNMELLQTQTLDALIITQNRKIYQIHMNKDLKSDNLKR
jgi:hypothetical protein